MRDVRDGAAARAMFDPPSEHPRARAASDPQRTFAELQRSNRTGGFFRALIHARSRFVRAAEKLEQALRGGGRAFRQLLSLLPSICGSAAHPSAARMALT